MSKFRKANKDSKHVSAVRREHPVKVPLAKASTYLRLLFFMLIFSCLQWLYIAAKGTNIERFVIDFATVKTAALFINTFDPIAGVTAVGTRLSAPGGGINILNGCEGLDVLFLVVAAMLVAPQKWSACLVGIAIGGVFIFLMNQIRIIALFYAFRNDKTVFDALHGFVTPFLLVIAAIAFFSIWLNRYSIQRNSAPY
jgi:exosortase/archaeosortase family protein